MIRFERKTELSSVNGYRAWTDVFRAWNMNSRVPAVLFTQKIMLAEHRVTLQSARAPQPKKRLRSEARIRPENVLRPAALFAVRSPPKVAR